MPSDFQLAEVPLSGIKDEIETFRITTTPGIEDLVSAFERVGLTNPPLLKTTQDGHIVVCGFRRIRAARSADWKTIPARVLPESIDPVSCALMAISENSVERGLNLIETSRAVCLLESLIEDRNKLLETAAGIGLPGNPSLLSKIRPLCRLPQVLQGGLLSGALALPSVHMLMKLPTDAAAALTDFLLKFKLSLHKQRELIDIIIEISKREGCSVESVLASQEICSILEEPNMDLPQTAGLIRSYLKERRYPNLTLAHAEFEKLKSQLKLGEHVSLSPPPGFESNRYTLSLTFGTPDELDTRAQTLAELSKDPDFRRFLSSRDSGCS